MMPKWVFLVVAAAVTCVLHAGYADDAVAKQFQIVTARGNVFTASEAILGGGTAIHNSAAPPAQNGSGVGFGYLPQIVIHEPPGETIVWGNSTHANAASVGPYMRVGGVDFAGMVKPDDHSISINLPSLSGEYHLSGGLLQGTNELYGWNSNWEDRGGWLELSGGPDVGGPQTSVVRLQDHYLANNIVNITGYATENATVKIITSPNDLAQLTLDGEDFAPKVLPLDSRLNYTKTLVDTQYSRDSRQVDQDITVDLLECVPGRSDSYAYRGFRCHNFAYPSYPAVLHTDFYAKDCIDPIETRQANLGSRQRPMYVDVMDGIDSGHARGQFRFHVANPPDFAYWIPVTLKTPPVIDCGPKVGGYHHITRIEQNQTSSYGGTYRFGPDAGTTVRGDFLQEIHGNVTLRTGEHDIHFEGTGLFEETVDPRRTTTTATKVTVDMEITSGSGRYAYFMLEAPDGQQQALCNFVCRGGTYMATFEPTGIAGDWKLHGKRTSLFGSVTLRSWTLTIGVTEYPERTLSPAYYPPSTSYTLADTITAGTGPHTQYRGDVYLVATGMNAPGEVVMVRATDHVNHSQLIIDNLPPYAPYMITDGGNILKMGMADSRGTIDIQYGEITAVLTGPVVFEYWPDSLTYAGSAHADGEGILFDPYNNAVVGFPWDPDDPLLYVSRAYVKMTIPVDGTSLDGVRLAGQDGRHVRYPYLVGVYGAGDEIFVPVFPGAREIHLRINGDWVQSYIKDVQQNSQARVFGGVRGYAFFQNAQATATATMFATQHGDAIALISATSSGSATHYLRTNYGHGAGVTDGSDRWTNARVLCYVNDHGSANYHCNRRPTLTNTCSDWGRYINGKAAEVEQYHAAVGAAIMAAASGGGISVSVYHNGKLVQAVSGSDADSAASSAVTGSFGNEHPDSHCRVIQTSVHGNFGRVESGAPWRSSHEVSTEFTDATFTRPVVLEGVEPGDQIDFVINAGSAINSVPEPLPHWSPSHTVSYSLSDVTLESGYIVLYQ